MYRAVLELEDATEFTDAHSISWHNHLDKLGEIY